MQDDSGIPVRFFKTEEWRLQPFGRYLGPIPVFSGRYQTKLSDVYRRSKPPPIDFGVGYRWRPHEFEPAARAPGHRGKARARKRPASADAGLP